MSYFQNLCAAMHLLHEHGAIFLGQGVGVPGTTMSKTLDWVPGEARIEMPVAEELQMGMATGMALGGLLPVCVFPRWNFVLRAADQIVNHLDRIPLYSGYTPRVIIRVAIPSIDPFNPGPQHSDDFSYAFECMFKTIRVRKLESEYAILPAYRSAIEHPFSTVLVEYTDMYKNERANDQG